MDMIQGMDMDEYMYTDKEHEQRHRHGHGHYENIWIQIVNFLQEQTVEAATRLAMPLEIREVCPEEIREPGVPSREVISLFLAFVQ